MRKISAFFAIAAAVSRPAAAEPGFAEPPGEVLVAADAPPAEREPEHYVEGSTVRVSVGPGLRLSKSATDGGLAAALDFGSGPVGGRFAGTWIRAGSDAGLSEYQGELWVDFGAGKRLHPILGAGAGVATLAHEEADGSLNESTYGVGVLRGTLEYVLPVERADARAGVDVVGSAPAVHPHGAPDPGAWVVLSARVGIGF
jgi:hypothetical protein